MKKMLGLVVPVLAIAAMALAAIQGASAQQSGVFEVVLPAQSLRLEIPDTGGRTLGESLGSITAFADGEECVGANVTDVNDDVVLQLGLAGQPIACSRNGAIVTFQDGDGRTLSASMSLVLGTSKTLESFATPAPTFDVLVPGNVGTDPLPSLDGRSLREATSPLTAYVGGSECLTFDISEPMDVIASFGEQGQSPPCFDDGGIVNFKNSQGYWLSTWFTLERGTQVTLSNFAPIPPCLPCVPPGPIPTSTDGPSVPAATPTPSSSTGSIRPPDTGSAGLR